MEVLSERIYPTYARSPTAPADGPTDVFNIATYNVHRWTGLTGGRRWNPDLASAVIEELDADVIALQEVLRPNVTDDPLHRIANELGLYFAFVPTRKHRMGMLGNAILSRWPMKGVFPMDLSFSRIEQRSAIVTQFQGEEHTLTVIATHLALVDRTRKFQVRSLLDHSWLQRPAILLGDMNAWRRCRATRELDRELASLHHNQEWPASYPAARPVLALDRIYTRGAHLVDIHIHNTPAARRGSDHLPVIARIALGPEEG
ncbi:MAG TPA: endonuclease/exonuclease/phosphatase family protein [Rhodothermales bacterium]|nr:endonuclease/exonuclease/phosphatase family protein [Rhodothermales bacterium]